MATRAAGLLLHPTSLPDRPGGLLASARELLSWMSEAGLTVWQVLPLAPAGPGGSPYSAASAFAIAPSWFDGPGEQDRERFLDENRDWLDDWCLYAALRKQQGRPWTAWDEALRARDEGALAEASRTLSESIALHRDAQISAHAGWSAVRDEARQRGIRILGDVPIYTALDSADVWAHQDLFHLDEGGLPTKVSGVPPDYFSETGQLWGNPLYRWDRMAETG